MKKYTKKMLLLTLLMSLCLIFSACGAASGSDEPETLSFTTKDGLVTIETDDTWVESEEYTAALTELELVNEDGIALDVYVDVKSDFNMDLKEYNDYSVGLWEDDEVKLTEEVQLGDTPGYKNVLEYIVDDKNSIVCIYVVDLGDYYVVMEIYSLLSDEEKVVQYADEYASKIKLAEQDSEQ